MSMNAVQRLGSSNPYRNLQSSTNPFTAEQTGPYKKSRWQSFLESLGIRTQADAWNENMQVQAQEYDAALAQKAYDEEYNLPVNQVARMRAAGINPDLDGGKGIDSGSAAPMGEDPSVPMQSTGEEDSIAAAANTLMSAVSGAFGIAKNIGEIRNLGIINDRGELENGERVARFAQWLTGQTHLTQQGTTPDEFSEHKRMAAADMFQGYKNFIPKKFQKNFQKSLATFYQSLDYAAASYSSQRKLNDDRLAVARQVQSKYFDPSDLNAMSVINKGLVRLSDLTQESSLKALQKSNERSIEEDQNAVIFQQELDPVAAARSQNEVNLNQAQSSKLQREIQSVMSDIVHELKGMADKGDIFAQSMLFSFALTSMSSVSFGPKGVSLGFNPSK